MKTLTSLNLAAADAGSYYTLTGCAEPLSDWQEHYEKLFAEREIGTPTEWFRTTGESVNMYAARRLGELPALKDQFPADLTILMFPLDGLHVGRLAAVKIAMGDRWFDDIISNMRRA